MTVLRTLYCSLQFFSFFFNDTATTEIYTLSLHDALPASGPVSIRSSPTSWLIRVDLPTFGRPRSEEHTSELQSRLHLVCRLLLEKKKIKVVMPDEEDSDIKVIE